MHVPVPCERSLSMSCFLNGGFLESFSDYLNHPRQNSCPRVALLMIMRRACSNYRVHASDFLPAKMRNGGLRWYHSSTWSASESGFSGVASFTRLIIERSLPCIYGCLIRRCLRSMVQPPMLAGKEPTRPIAS